MLLLQVLGMFVLVVTLVDVTQVLLARASQHATDTAIRAGLGASMWQSQRSTLFESCLVAIGGAALSNRIRVGFGIGQELVGRAGLAPE